MVIKLFIHYYYRYMRNKEYHVLFHNTNHKNEKLVRRTGRFLNEMESKEEKHLNEIVKDMKTGT